MEETKSKKTSGRPGKGWDGLYWMIETFQKRKLLIIASFLILFAVLCGLQYMRNLHTARTVLSLDFEEASQGLAPNRTRFNIYDIRSREVMEMLIDYAGLEGETTPDELSKCIGIKATHNKNISGSVNYISTSFVISFTSKSIFEKRSAEDMLALLCKAYREYFVKHYGFNHSILSFHVDDLKFNDEYLMMVDLLELKGSQLEKYVQLRKRESKNYEDPNTGITFSQLEQRAKNFYTYDIVNLRSFVIENGIVNDRLALKPLLNYKIHMDRLMYDKLIAAYNEDNKGIQIYDTAMSAVIMIPTQDQTKQYYMSRAKTGMDNMALHANTQLVGATERMEQIKYNTYLMEKLTTNDSDLAHREKADTMIREKQAILEKLAADIQAVDSSYTSAKARDYLGFRENRLGFADRIGLLPSFFTALFILLIAFVCMSLRRSLSEKKEKVETLT